MPDFTDRTWLWLATALYLAGFALGMASLLLRRRRAPVVAYMVILAGFGLQTLGLYERGLAVKGCPLGNLFEFLQFTAWSAVLLYLVIGATFRLSLLGDFTSLLTAGLTSVSLAVPAWDASRRVDVFGGNPWIELHASLALFSYGVFALLALTSVMYLLQVFSLKRHRLHGLFAFLPPVRDLDHINLRLLWAGVLILGAAIVLGSVYWLDASARADLAIKVVFTVGVWVGYAVALTLRLRNLLVSRRLAWLCIALFAGALLSLQPVNSSRAPLRAAAPGAAAR